MNPPWIALGVAATLVGGVVLHELAHGLAAALFAERWTIDWREPATYAEYDDATWEPYAVGGAPYLIALVWLVGLLVGGGLPGDAWAALPWLGGGVVVVGGGFDEFRFEADDTSETDTSAREAAGD